MKHYIGICLILIILAGIGFFALRSCTLAVDQSVDHVRDAFTQVLRLQPQVTVNQRVVLTQTAPIAELAIVTKEELVSVGVDEHFEVMSIEVPLTEKTISAEAVYRLKAGFDLREPFRVEIDSATGQVKASMPHAKILSVEPVGDLTYHGDDSLLNRITDEERIKIINALNSAARDTAEKSSLKSEAEMQIAQRLQELIKHNGQSMNIEWTNPSDLVPSQRS
ncbi:MAG TPA: DUF4230 domain-containing protein [Candidatus Methylacidiphilales bacterium]|nr:DUF4230 domain-containing protein [Candidatus Methylacidiphilales bacterium]